MRMRNWIVTEEDFGDDFIGEYSCSSVSPLDYLAIVAQKALEKETALSSTLFLDIPMLERHKPIKRKLFKCQATEVEKNSMVERQFTSCGNPKIKGLTLQEIEETAPKPNIPTPMVEVEEKVNSSPKRNIDPSGAQSSILPQHFKEVFFSMGGTDPVMVIQKRLFKCDVDKGQCRITMPVRECERRLLLTEEEKQMLAVRDAKKSLVGIRVRVIEPGLQDRELTFKKWHYNENSSNYVLVNNWFEVVVKNELRKGDDVQIWSFRIDGKLAFALVKLPRSCKNSLLEVHEQSSFAFKWGTKRRRT